MLVHGYRQVLRLARLPRRPPFARFVRTTRDRATRFLDMVTVHAQRGIVVTETAVGRVVGAAPRPSRRVFDDVFERVVRFAPRLAGRSFEVALMAAIGVAAVVLAFVLVNGFQSASGQVIDVLGDAVGAALTELDLDQP